MKPVFNVPYFLLKLSLWAVAFYFLFLESGHEYLAYAALFLLLIQRLIYWLSRKRR